MPFYAVALNDFEEPLNKISEVQCAIDFGHAASLLEERGYKNAIIVEDDYVLAAKQRLYPFLQTPLTEGFAKLIGEEEGEQISLFPITPESLEGF